MNRYIKNLKKFFIFFLIFVISFCVMFFIRPGCIDEIRNYGFAYNIYQGMVPYRDFNMIITPLYAFLSSIFVMIFGNHLWSVHIFNSFIVIFMLFLMYRRIKFKVLIFLPIIFMIVFPDYNFFSLFLMIILFEVCNKICKYTDIFIALIISCLFLTKQTIGICCFLPMMFYSKNRVKSFITFMIPIIIFFLYLFYNNALYNFIDYCFLGMFDFSNRNNMYLFLPFEIVILVLLCILLLKRKFSDKELFYAIAYQIITIPICDVFHFFFGMFIILYYLFLKFKVNNFLIFLICLFIMSFFSMYIYKFSFNFYNDKDSFLYGKNFEMTSETVNNMRSSLLKFNDEYDYVYLFFDSSYVMKLDTDISINKFDLINYGNMGYNGIKKYIREIDNMCDNSKTCLFIVGNVAIDHLDDFSEFVGSSQFCIELCKYVDINYKKIDKNSYFYFYSNNN